MLSTSPFNFVFPVCGSKPTDIADELRRASGLPVKSNCAIYKAALVPKVEHFFTAGRGPRKASCRYDRDTRRCPCTLNPKVRFWSISNIDAVVGANKTAKVPVPRCLPFGR